MIEWNAALPRYEFDVQVGHLCVRVHGTSRVEAIKNAKQKLCHEMPRMWDVIHGLSDDRFEVSRSPDAN